MRRRVLFPLHSWDEINGRTQSWNRHRRRAMSWRVPLIIVGFWSFRVGFNHGYSSLFCTFFTVLHPRTFPLPLVYSGVWTFRHKRWECCAECYFSSFRALFPFPTWLYGVSGQSWAGISVLFWEITVTRGLYSRLISLFLPNPKKRDVSHRETDILKNVTECRI